MVITYPGGRRDILMDMRDAGNDLDQISPGYGAWLAKGGRNEMTGPRPAASIPGRSGGPVEKFPEKELLFKR